MSSIWTQGMQGVGADSFSGESGRRTEVGSGGRSETWMGRITGAGAASAGAPGGSAAAGPPSTLQTAPAAGAAAAATDTSSGSAASITANDFLTLLVTEMQNQDPTAQTDPNEYINQLVQINSLEQLISINQNLSAVLGAATSPVPPSSPSSSVAGVAPAGAAMPRATPNTAPGSAAAPGRAAGTTPRQPGRPTPGTSGSQSGRLAASAHSVARALDGHRQGVRRPSARDIPTHRL